MAYGTGVMSTDVIDWVKAAVQNVSVTGLLFFFVIGGFKRWWVWGYQLEEMQKERDWWKERSLNNTELVRSAMSVAQNAVSK